ncbi:HpcH/HpaI aldolase family protein [Halobacillus litoralis]|uniref:HpcH/HpaI aldolase family protein n=1 Tax=Halobacillus litoralis TaxID=45668 RepID=UPI001CD431E1|nr:aldolase/citrate lyase family protein [Halobacillus litoralis]MCA1023839.1 hypothetical protein [Halobacillus litoralis]
MIKENFIKNKLEEGDSVIGTFVKMADSSSVEIMGMAGFDFIVIDSEHVGFNIETITHLIRTAELYQMVPIIRVKRNEKTEILQALDCGALGVQVPNVDTHTDAKNIVQSTKYDPIGSRGFAPSHRAAGFGMMNIKEYVELTNKETMIICHCETVESINNIEEILSEKEVDVVFIGPMDLSQSLGVIGESDHPKVKAAITQVVKKIKAAGKVVGMVAPNAKVAREYINMGVQYVTISSDQGMIANLGQSIIQQLKDTK